MTTQLDVQTIADRLYQAAQSGIAIPPIRDVLGIEDLETAYAIQALNTRKRISLGAKVTGKKIGLTSFAVQEQLGVDQPDYGVLLDSMEVSNQELMFSALMQPKAEAEIAFVMAKDLDGDINIADLIEAIDYVTVSIEIVGSRIANWDIKITDTIADNASASHYILGESKVNIEEVDLVSCQMTLTKNDEIVSKGSGAACMDNPLNAALWLAQTMASQGNPLRQGEILLSGALGPMVPIEKGDKFVAKIDGLGSVSLMIT
ncbi:MAG: 2-keto-4-pentenoate hydratase [Bacteroidetes bacterium]|nr:MAG: 2-keto-4-pentenoate hydratase [Bacteroidota bacterium]